MLQRSPPVMLLLLLAGEPTATAAASTSCGAWVVRDPGKSNAARPIANLGSRTFLLLERHESGRGKQARSLSKVQSTAVEQCNQYSHTVRL